MENLQILHSNAQQKLITGSRKNIFLTSNTKYKEKSTENSVPKSLNSIRGSSTLLKNKNIVIFDHKDVFQCKRKSNPQDFNPFPLESLTSKADQNNQEKQCLVVPIQQYSNKFFREKKEAEQIQKKKGTEWIGKTLKGQLNCMKKARHNNRMLSEFKKYKLNSKKARDNKQNKRNEGYPHGCQNQCDHIWGNKKAAGSIQEVQVHLLDISNNLREQDTNSSEFIPFCSSKVKSEILPTNSPSQNIPCQNSMGFNYLSKGCFSRDNVSDKRALETSQKDGIAKMANYDYDRQKMILQSKTKDQQQKAVKISTSRALQKFSVVLKHITESTKSTKSKNSQVTKLKLKNEIAKTIRYQLFEQKGHMKEMNKSPAVHKSKRNKSNSSLIYRVKECEQNCAIQGFNQGIGKGFKLRSSSKKINSCKPNSKKAKTLPTEQSIDCGKLEKDTLSGLIDNQETVCYQRSKENSLYSSEFIGHSQITKNKKKANAKQTVNKLCSFHQNKRHPTKTHQGHSEASFIGIMARYCPKLATQGDDFEIGGWDVSMDGP